MLLKNPTYLNSPIALNKNIVGIIQLPYFIIHSGKLYSKIPDLRT